MYIFLYCFFLSLNIYCKETYKMKQKDKQTNIFTNLHEKFVDLSEYICKKNVFFYFCFTFNLVIESSSFWLFLQMSHRLVMLTSLAFCPSCVPARHSVTILYIFFTESPVSYKQAITKTPWNVKSNVHLKFLIIKSWPQ